jgi:heat shock protein HslJ
MNMFNDKMRAIAATVVTAAVIGTGWVGQGSASDWNIVSINGTATQGDPRISFDDVGQFQGHTGCNSFRGSGAPEVNQLSITGPVITTRMACPPGIVQTQEDAVLNILQEQVDLTYDAFSETLTFNRANQTMQMRPRLSNSGESAGIAPTVFDSGYLMIAGTGGPLNIREEPTTDALKVTRALVGTLLRNKGCEVRPDRTWCQIEFIDASGTTGWAAGEFLAPAPAALRAEHGVFDEIGRLTCKPKTEAEQDCDFGVARDGNHSAAVTIFLPDGSERVLHFAEGVFVYASANPLGETLETGYTADGDAVSITVGQDVYRIPKRYIYGT